MEGQRQISLTLKLSGSDKPNQREREGSTECPIIKDIFQSQFAMAFHLGDGGPQVLKWP